MTSNEKFEREFEAFINEEDSRLAALYRKLPQAEPDAKLDATVRSMAHRALNPQLVATPRTETQWRRARWLPAFGAAAGIVLAAGIALRVDTARRNERDGAGAPASDVITVRQLDVPPPPAAPPLSPTPPPETAASLQAVLPAPGKPQSGTAPVLPEASRPAAAPLEREKTAQPSEPADNRPATAGGLTKTENATKAAAQPQAFPAPAQAQKRASEMDAVERKQIMAAGAWQNLHDRDERESPKSADKSARRDNGASAAAAAKSVPPPTAASPPTAVREEPAATAATRRPQPQTESAQSAAPSAPSPATTTSAVPPPREQAKSAPLAVGEPQPAAAEQPGAGSADQAAGLRAKDDRLKARARSNDPNAALYPEHWLTNIRAMLHENRRDDALRSLAEFRRLYPDYHLPDDLRDLGKP